MTRNTTTGGCKVTFTYIRDVGTCINRMFAHCVICGYDGNESARIAPIMYSSAMTAIFIGT